MTKEQIEKLYSLHKNLTTVFDAQELSDCAEELKGILENICDKAQENKEVIQSLEKADAAIDYVLCEFEEYEIGGAFAAVVGNNSQLRAIYKENVQLAIGLIDEILKRENKQ